MRYSLIFILVFISFQAFSQAEYITSFRTDQYGGPSVSFQADGYVFFTAFDTSGGRELWRSDGTASGTYRIKDVWPGSFSGLGDYFQYTSYLMDDILYFRGNDGVHGIELWRSDGTDAGTYMVKDIEPGPGHSSAGAFCEMNGILYFTGGTGSQLWRSDGTNAGTYSIASFQVITNLAAFNNHLYFSADINNTGQELWKSDGTPSGTNLLKDLNGSVGASLPCNFFPTANTLFFTAMTADGWELWKTTGSANSTVMVKDINPGPGNSILNTYGDIRMIELGNYIYFRATDGVTGYDLWRSDGSDTGTVIAADLPFDIDASCPFKVSMGKIFLNDYAIPYYYVYDTVSDSTYETGYPSYYYFNSYPSKNTFINNIMIYAGEDSLLGAEMWVSDGTVAGTHYLQETHLTDNWNPSSVQGFNNIFATWGDTIIYTLARRPYDTEIPFFRYIHSIQPAITAPSVFVLSPVNATTFYLIWDRPYGASEYEIRWRPAGFSVWINDSSSNSFYRFLGLQVNSDIEYQVRAKHSGTWSDWSAQKSFNTSFSSDDYILHILADRSESNSSHRIFWLQTSQITNMQIRYREYGTTAWSIVSNANGSRLITGLQPSTFYEYQYRPFIGGAWDVWYPTSLHFATPDSVITSVENIIRDNNFMIYPIPAFSQIIIPKDLYNLNYTIYDNSGRKIKSGLTSGQLNIGDLNSGLYLLHFENEGEVLISRFIKQ